MSLFNRLVELVSLLKRYNKTNIKCIDEKLDPSTKEAQLYAGICDGTYTSEEQTARLLYGIPPNKKAYSTLQHRLDKRLCNSLRHFDGEHADFNEAQKAYNRCYTALWHVNILIARGARLNATHICKNHIKEALYYEFTIPAYTFAHVLKTYAAPYKDERTSFLKHQKIALEQAELLPIESKLAAYRDYIFNIHAGTVANDEAANSEVGSHVVRAENHIRYDTIKSYQSMRDAFLIICMSHELTANYQEAIITCERAVAYFEAKATAKDTYKKALFTFRLRKFVYLTILKNYKAAEACALTCVEASKAGTLNWFRSMEYYLLLCFHSHRYEKAYTLWEQAQGQVQYIAMQAQDQELWQVYTAYVHFFVRHHKLDCQPKEKTKIYVFNAKQFIKNVPTYIKDKRGMKVCIVIIQVLYLLLERKYSETSQRVELLNDYAQRELHKEETQRSFYFIKMLVVVVKARFNKEKAERESMELRKELTECKRQASNVEIVPYEELWEVVIGLLRSKYWYKPKR